MKKFFYFAVVAIVAILVSSCQKQTTTIEKQVKTTVKEIGTEGFLIKEVIKGDTVWGYSEEVYGTGFSWRDIVAENPFLNEPGRIYYDQNRERWIVIIYPGESVIIKGQVITPTFTSEETTVTTTTETAGIPWWGWLLMSVGGIIIIFFLLGTVGLVFYQKCYRPEPACCYRPTPTTPSVVYHTMVSGDRTVRVEGARETIISHSTTSGELKITTRQ